MASTTTLAIGVVFRRQGTLDAGHGLPFHARTERPFHAATGEGLATLAGHSDRITAAAMSPDESTVLSASQDHTLKLWDPESGMELLTLKGHTGWVLACAFFPNGRMAISAGGDGTLRFWDMETGEEVHSFVCLAPVYSVCVSPIQPVVCAGDSMGTVHILCFRGGEVGYT